MHGRYERKARENSIERLSEAEERRGKGGGKGVQVVNTCGLRDYLCRKGERGYLSEG